MAAASSGSALYLSNGTPLPATKLGKGAFGAVYSVPSSEASPLIARVAKVFLEADFENRQRSFKHELKIAEQIRGAVNVVQLSDPPFSEAAGSLPVLFFARAPGTTLGKLPACRLTTLQKAMLAKGLLEGLEGLLEKDVVHFDLKPENILFDPESGAVTIIDPGIAELRADFDPWIATPAAKFRTGFLKQTSWYRDPLVIVGAYRGHPDLFSLGMTLLEVLSGKPVLALDPRYTPKSMTENQLHLAMIDHVFRGALTPSPTLSASPEPSEEASVIDHYFKKPEIPSPVDGLLVPVEKFHIPTCSESPFARTLGRARSYPSLSVAPPTSLKHLIWELIQLGPERPFPDQALLHPSLAKVRSFRCPGIPPGAVAVLLNGEGHAVWRSPDSSFAVDHLIFHIPVVPDDKYTLRVMQHEQVMDFDATIAEGATIPIPPLAPPDSDSDRSDSE